jgi:hypothetical protein
MTGRKRKGANLSYYRDLYRDCRERNKERIRKFYIEYYLIRRIGVKYEKDLLQVDGLDVEEENKQAEN